MSAIRIFARLRELLDVVLNTPQVGEVLAYDGEKWTNAKAASTERGTTPPVTTPAIADGATWSGTITVGKSAIAQKITANAPAWIRIYQNADYLAADADRAQTEPEKGEHGLILEVVLPAENLTWDLSPQPAFSSLTGTDGYAISIRNLSGSTQSLTVTVNRLVLES